MSRQFSIFTKGLVYVLVLVMLASLATPVRASGSDCDDLKDKAWAATKHSLKICGGTTLGCAAAIAAGNFLGLAGCAWFFFFICQPTQMAAADAWAAYYNCTYTQAGSGG